MQTSEASDRLAGAPSHETTADLRARIGELEEVSAHS